MAELDNSEVQSEQGSKKSWWSRSKTPKEPKEAKPGVFDRKPAALTIEQVRERDRLLKQQASENPAVHSMYVQQMGARGIRVEQDFDHFRAANERAAQQQQLHNALVTTQVLRDPLPAPQAMPPPLPPVVPQYSVPPSPQSSVTQVPLSPQQADSLPKEKRGFFKKKETPGLATLEQVQDAEKFVLSYSGPLPTSSQYHTSEGPLQPQVKGRGLRAYGPDGTELFPPKNQPPPPAVEDYNDSRTRSHRHRPTHHASKYSSKKRRNYRHDSDSDSDSMSDSSTDSSLSSMSNSASSSSSEELAPPWETNPAFRRVPKPRPLRPYIQPSYHEQDIPMFATHSPARFREPIALEPHFPQGYYPRNDMPYYDRPWEEFPEYEQPFYDAPVRGYPTRGPYTPTPRRSITDPGVAFVDEIVPAPYIETSPQWGREGRSFQ
eukprot:TRINITY_DN779_c0_g1_i1.p1 TRINITY_DN779_c0_g1~~TRINITY_DN779_c0_g1_i1.p1  ORF type:complete len:434 (+),score=35.35 TRINITY_DN779_c0_g1_i1:47-1348(+)